MTASDEQRRTEWAERVEYYAREAVDKTRPFAEALVALVDPAPGARVLDIATGPGVVAVAAARSVGPAGSVLATDLVPEWESYVASAAREAGVANVTFAEMPANHLALPDESFDVALCQFGLMFVSDALAALGEMRRVLRPGGVVGVTVWSVPEKVGIFSMSRILGAALPPPPGEPAPSPTSMGEPGLIEGLVAAAGFQDLVVERITRYATMPSPEEAWRQWSESPGNPAARGLASLSPPERERIRDEIIAVLEPFRDGDGVSVPSEAILVKATKD
ncbi:MAG: methyltransferase domain-containing protein [Thermomicrobiales bacterium]